MKIFKTIAVLLFAIELTGTSPQVFLCRRGAISVGGRRFQMVFFNEKWRSYPQYTPMPGYYRIEKKDPSQVLISMNFPEAKNGTLHHEIHTEGPNRWSLTTHVNFANPGTLKAGVMSLSLPAAQCKGLKLTIDDQKLILPLNTHVGQNAILFRKQCRELRIPDEYGEWIFRGNYHLLIQDNRCFRGGHDFELRFSFRPENPPDRYPAILNLKIDYQHPQWTFLDLSSGMNMGLADETAGDGTGGWTDQGKENDLRMLWNAPEKHPKEFKLTDPAKNKGKACIMLRGKMRSYFPETVSVKLPGSPKGDLLYLLHALSWRGTASGLGSMELIYEDGTHQTIEVKAGRDAGNWWKPSPIENGSVAWIGENASSFIGLYRSMFRIHSKPLSEIRFRSDGNAVWGILAATVGNFEIPQNPIIPYYILEGKEWEILEFKKEVKKGSALDFSSRLDAPAGKYGPVVIRNGRFEFRDRPGVPARFYGTNLCAQAVYPDREWAEKIADRIGMAGFNAVRLHHHDSFMVNPRKSTELDQKAMDRLDYFLACLKKRGIYIQTDLFVSRHPAADEIPGYHERIMNFDLYKAFFFIQDSFFENWKQYVYNYLNHKNPYTGAVVKDDPMLISLGLVNEDNINKKWDASPVSRKSYQNLFQEFLKKRGITYSDSLQKNRLFDEFLTILYQKRLRQMKEFIRGLGCEKPLSDQNMGVSPHLTFLRQEYDFVDNHLYYNHPEFAGNSWGLPSFTDKKSVLGDFASTPAYLFPSRIFGKPFLVTEFDFARPNPHRADGALLFGVYGALQQWDGLFQFAYSHGLNKIKYTRETGGFFDLATDPVKLLSQYLGSTFFLNGELENGFSEKYGIPIKSRKPYSFELLYPPEYAKIGLTAKIGVFPEGQAFQKEKILPESRAELKQMLKPLAANGEFCSSDGMVRLNPARRTFQAVTPRAEAFILPEGEKRQGTFCCIRNRIGSAVFGVLALDGRPLLESKRILLLHLTDSAASKMRYADQEQRKLESWGTLPFLAARGEAEFLVLSPSGHERCYALDTSGKRLGEIPVKNGKIDLRVFQPFGSVFCYELIKSN